MPASAAALPVCCRCWNSQIQAQMMYFLLLLLQMLIFAMYLAASCMMLDRLHFGRGGFEGQKEGGQGLGMHGWPAKTLVGARSAGRPGRARNMGTRLLTRVDWPCLAVLALLELYCAALHPLVLPGLLFLPLMLTSVLCALGLLWVWVDLWVLCCGRACQRKMQ